MMQKIWRETHKIRYSQFDREGRMKLNAWSDLLQEAAASHAEELGVGMRALAEKKLLWILAQVKVSFGDAPSPGKNVEVVTYPSGGKRLFATREFLIRDENQNEILRGSSRWVVLAAETLRPQSFSTVADKLPDNSDLPVYFDFAEKLPIPESFDFSRAITATHSMEDVNGHLNNASYLAAAQDALCMEGIVKEFSGYEIVYHKAIRYPEILTLHFKTDDSSAFFAGFNEKSERCVSGKLVFR